ncbi:predicted protein [Nematostella vectensis]|uniref:Integrase zinc-binding domain-containing protein n=1 Tax=Nematostella vectensis TaxID=45351 RepID=A7S6R1_NEMVE|nr:predicted protein [Nematostella vectensis]|eukprot:XP_001632661.1 predicted protein [Nematostella vectensis]
MCGGKEWRLGRLGSIDQTWFNRSGKGVSPTAMALTSAINKRGAQDIKDLVSVGYTLASIRQQYWPVWERELTKQILKKCVTCRKLRGNPSTQLMADLPESRRTVYEVWCSRATCCKRGRNVAVDDFVLDPNQPRGKWLRGRVKEIFPDSKGATFPGLLYHSKNSADGILEIIKELHQYVPFIGAGDARIYADLGVIGDQLSVERAVNIHASLSNGFTPDERLDGLHFEIADA